MFFRYYYLCFSIVLVSPRLYGQTYTNYDNNERDPFRSTLLADDLNFNDSERAKYDESIQLGQVLKDSAIVMRSTKMLMRYALFIDSFSNATNSKSNTLSAENAILRGIEWFNLTKDRNSLILLDKTSKKLKLSHLLSDIKEEHSHLLKKPRKRGNRSGYLTESSLGSFNQYQLFVSNETDEIIYIYIDGVYHKKIYGGKTTSIRSSSDCSMFEAENRLGQIGKRSICFTKKKSLKWAIKKSIN